MPPEPKIPDPVRKYLTLWGNCWKIDSLEERLTVVFSRKMVRTLGNFRPEPGLIRLNGALADGRNEGIFREVLCHEAAHAAIFFLFGNGCRPHGREWKSLMKEALYLPRALIPEKEVFGLAPSRRKNRYLYFHKCVNCGVVTRGRRTDRRWRCKRCLLRGLEGRLKVVKRQEL